MSVARRETIIHLDLDREALRSLCRMKGQPRKLWRAALQALQVISPKDLGLIPRLTPYSFGFANRLRRYVPIKVGPTVVQVAENENEKHLTIHSNIAILFIDNDNGDDNPPTGGVAAYQVTEPDHLLELALNLDLMLALGDLVNEPAESLDVESFRDVEIILWAGVHASQRDDDFAHLLARSLKQCAGDAVRYDVFAVLANCFPEHRALAKGLDPHSPRLLCGDFPIVDWSMIGQNTRGNGSAVELLHDLICFEIDVPQHRRTFHAGFDNCDLFSGNVGLRERESLSDLISLDIDISRHRQPWYADFDDCDLLSGNVALRERAGSRRQCPLHDSPPKQKDQIAVISTRQQYADPHFAGGGLLPNIRQFIDLNRGPSFERGCSSSWTRWDGFGPAPDDLGKMYHEFMPDGAPRDIAQLSRLVGPWSLSFTEDRWPSPVRQWHSVYPASNGQANEEFGLSAAVPHCASAFVGTETERPVSGRYAFDSAFGRSVGVPYGLEEATPLHDCANAMLAARAFSDTSAQSRTSPVFA
jgi:hypothetical protein